jgi:hypothetical protein
LKVQVTPKLTLLAGNLVLADSLTKKEIKFNVTGDTARVDDHNHSVTVTVNRGGEHDHRVYGNTKSASSHTHEIDLITYTRDGNNEGDHSHSASGSIGNDGGHSHDVNIPVTLTIDNSLKKGDSVILVRMQGGNKYLILDKAVNA